MKHRKILLVLLAAGVVLLLGSCDQLMSSLFGVSIEARIDAFEDTLNTEDRADILDHLHVDMRNRQQLADPTVIDASPLGYANEPFVIGAPEVDDNDVAVCSFQHINASGTIEFTMKREGLDYKILRLKLSLNDGDTTLDFRRFWQ